MGLTSRSGGGKVPPDNYDDAVRWVYDPQQEGRLTNAWNRLVCRPKAWELGIPGVESGKAPTKDEFIAKSYEFQGKAKPRTDVKAHLIDKGIRWGFRYDKGLSKIAEKGTTIKLTDVVPMENRIPRSDTPAWKNLPGEKKAQLKERERELRRELKEGQKSKDKSFAEKDTSLTLKAPKINYLPTKVDCEKAIEELLRDGSNDVDENDVLDWLETHFKNKDVPLKINWMMITKENLKIWFK